MFRLFGGKVNVVVDLVDFIYENGIKVWICDVCVLVCVEIILILMFDVIFEYGILVGFYGNL